MHLGTRDSFPRFGIFPFIAIGSVDHDAIVLPLPILPTTEFRIPILSFVSNTIERNPIVKLACLLLLTMRRPILTDGVVVSGLDFGMFDLLVGLVVKAPVR